MSQLYHPYFSCQVSQGLTKLHFHIKTLPLRSLPAHLLIIQSLRRKIIMIGIVTGQLVTTKLKQPEQGQEFKPHQMLNVMQIHNDEAEVVKIKDLDLTRQHKTSTNVKLKCRINHWSNSNTSGQAVTLLEVL